MQKSCRARNLSRQEVGLSELTTVDLSSEFARRAQTLRAVPACVRGRWRNALRFVLEARQKARAGGDVEAETNAWKLFGLLPTLLLRKEPGEKQVPRRELERRFDLFAEGRFKSLL